MAMEFRILAAVILAYLSGSFPTSVWVGKVFFHTDVREHGSGNAGATNTIRVLGWKAGIPVLVLDVFKGWFAVHIGTIISGNFAPESGMTWFQIGLAASAVAGHVFPVFAGFRGGKGVATLLGIGLALYPVSAWLALSVFVITLALSGYVSLSSVVAAVSFPFIELIAFRQDHPGLMALAVAVAVFIPITHRNNIRRLLKGEEKGFSLRRKSK
jgi:glycerol-3-phosphate acyltransferase PlsY